MSETLATPITPETVRQTVERIREAAGDDEAAHGMEDELHFDVLKAIAEGTCENPQECARLAIQTAEIGFARWYA